MVCKRQAGLNTQIYMFQAVTTCIVLAIPLYIQYLFPNSFLSKLKRYIRFKKTADDKRNVISQYVNFAIKKNLLFLILWNNLNAEGNLK